jgi:small subunit ribosomal protein S18
MVENLLNKQRKSKKKKISPKTDYFFRENIEYIDYKDTASLRKFINRQGRIIHRKQSWLTAKHQRRVAQAIKRARQMALLPYIIVEQNE